MAKGVEIITKKVLARHTYKKVGANTLHPAAEKIVKEIAKEFGYPIMDVRKAICAPYALLKQIRSEEPYRTDPEKGFPNIRLPYMGIFYSREKYVERYCEKHKNAVSNK